MLTSQWPGMLNWKLLTKLKPEVRTVEPVYIIYQWLPAMVEWGEEEKHEGGKSRGLTLQVKKACVCGVGGGWKAGAAAPIQYSFLLLKYRFFLTGSYYVQYIWNVSELLRFYSGCVGADLRIYRTPFWFMNGVPTILSYSTLLKKKWSVAGITIYGILH